MSRHRVNVGFMSYYATLHPICGNIAKLIKHHWSDNKYAEQRMILCWLQIIDKINTYAEAGY